LQYIVLFTNIYCKNIYLHIYIIYFVSQTLTDSEIIDAVLGRKLNGSTDSDDSNGSVDEENKMTMAEAISCCDNLINYME
jgi:methyltransferase-like protein